MKFLKSIKNLFQIKSKNFAPVGAITIALVIFTIGFLSFIFVKKTNFTKEIYYPTLQFPIRYFSQDDWSAGHINGVDFNNSKEVIFGGDDAYQSFPTTEITLSKSYYDNQIRDLFPAMTKEKFLMINDSNESLESYRKAVQKGKEVDYWMDCWDMSDCHLFDGEKVFEEIKKEYGELGLQIASDDSLGWANETSYFGIDSIKQIDLNGDGLEDEKLVFATEFGYGGGNYRETKFYIVKDSKILFSTISGKIEESKTGNGFYLFWKSDKVDVGIMKTRFVFENGQFTPIYEQEIKFFKVQNTEYKTDSE